MKPAFFSLSRARMLEECPRQFWYTVYGGENGWWFRNRPPASPRAEKLYQVRKTHTTVPVAIGLVAHSVMAWGIRSAAEFPGEMDRGVIRSRLTVRAAREISGFVKTAVFIDQEDDPEELLRDGVRSAIMAATSDDTGWTGDLNGSNLYLRALSRPQKIMLCDEMVSFVVISEVYGPVTVWISPDVVIRGDEPKSAVVIDWKTGSESLRHHDQIAVYMAWCATREWSHVKGFVSYLRGERGAEVQRTTASLQEASRSTADRVDVFMGQLAPRLVGRDLFRNEAVESKFEPTTNPSTCRGCFFASQCQKDGTKPVG